MASPVMTITWLLTFPPKTASSDLTRRALTCGSRKARLSFGLKSKTQRFIRHLTSSQFFRCETLVASIHTMRFMCKMVCFTAHRLAQLPLTTSVWRFRSSQRRMKTSLGGGMCPAATRFKNLHGQLCLTRTSARIKRCHWSANQTSTLKIHCWLHSAYRRTRHPPRH